MNLGIGAIFKDEFDYILEWLAWHQMAGFNNFFIADNGSTDGCKEILEALSEIGKINLIYQPTLEKLSQLKAYQRISEICLNKMDAIFFIDADEFIVHESMIDGIEYKYLYSLLKNPDVGMVGVNWRCFGSSGLKFFNSTPVVERFNKIESDKKKSSINQFLKSISKVKYIKNINPHSARIFEKRYVNVLGEDISDFILFVNDRFIDADHSGRVKSITKSPLRVNHYVIKSKEEFFEKKEKRGDAMLGPSHERGMRYFEAHDFDEDEFHIPNEKLERLKVRIEQLKKHIQETSYAMNLRGYLDVNNKDKIEGWIVNEEGCSKKLKINIFVNSVYQGSADCGFYRPDLKEKGISNDGLSGFRFTHPMPLKSGDKVEIFVHANNYKFPQNASVEIN